MYLAHVVDANVVKLKLEGVPVAEEFPDVFPDEPPGLPPNMETEFVIDLLPGITLIF